MVVMERQSPALDGALATARAGYRIVTIVPGTKGPRQSQWPKVATTDPSVFIPWFAAHPEDGLGLATGRYQWADGSIHCLLVVDVDSGDKVNPKTGVIERRRGDDSWRELQQAVGEMPDTVTALTGGGGYHYLYWLPEGVEVGNDQDGKLGVNIDFRCIGGQILVWPTIHCDTGRMYQWCEGRAPWDIPAAMATQSFVDYLLAIARPTKERNQATGEYSNRRPAGTGSSPIDQMMDQFTWREVLESAGWTYESTRPDPLTNGTYETWTRPGKASGTSASLNYGGQNVLMNFSTSVPTMKTGATYTKEGFVAANFYGGDNDAGFMKLRATAEAAGYVDLANKRRDENLKKIWEAIPGGGPDSVSRSLPNTLPEPVATEFPENFWPEKIDLIARSSPPVFPIGVLGGWLQRTCESMAEAMNVPVDVPAHMALSILSFFAMPVTTLRLSMTHTDSVNLYVLLVVRSGGGKSPIWKALMKPVFALEKAAIRERQKQQRAAEVMLTVAAKRRDVLIRDVTSGKESGDEMILEQDQVVAGWEQKAGKRGGHWFPDDATPERIVQIMESNDGCVGVMSDEGGEQIDIFGGRYSDNASLGCLLKGFDGSRLSQARVNRDDVFIPEALVTFMLAVQPGVLDGIMANGKWEDRGLTARLLLSYPPENPTSLAKHHLMAGPEKDAQRMAVEADWAAHIFQLTSRLNQYSRPGADDIEVMMSGTTPMMTPGNRYTIQFDHTAQATFANFEYKMMKKTERGRDLEHLRPWMKKMTTQVARLSALIYIADGADGPLDASYVKRAIQVGLYWRDHALRAFTMGGAAIPKPINDALRLYRWAARFGTFTLTDAFRALPMLGRTAKIAAITDLLCEHYYLRRAGVGPDGTEMFIPRPPDADDEDDQDLADPEDDDDDDHEFDDDTF